MICENIKCGESFHSPSKKAKYCCLICANIVQAERLKHKTRKCYESSPILCKSCSEPIPFEKRHDNKFCNSSCAATYTNVLYPKRVSQFAERPCESCNKVFRQKHRASKGRFCCNKCAKEYHRNVVSKGKILNGEIRTSRTLKVFLINEREEKCEECKQGAMWNGKPLSLQVDHIDGNPDNNFPENLRLLCPNCHTQTETFGARNHGANSKRNDYRIQYRKRQ